MSAEAVEFRDLAEAILDSERRFAAANPLSQARHLRARGVLPGGHSRQTLYYAPFPVTFVRGKDAHLTDLDGHEYVDLVGDYAAGVLGHTCEPVQRAAREALSLGLSLGGVNSKEVELAELISARIPSIQQIRFCNSGSEACLFGVQLARHASRRPKVMVFKGCYHGAFLIYGNTDPALSIPLEIIKATYNDVEGTRAALRADASGIGTIIVEPMMGAAGAIPGSREFLGMLREETHRMGAVLIFDEVMTSRVSPGGLQGFYGITPDITTLGKFWGGGFPFGAFGGSREVMRNLDLAAGGVLSQGGTFNANIVTMAAGIVAVRDVYTPQACTELNARGDRLRAALQELAVKARVALQLTGIGGTFNLHWHTRPIRHAGDVEPPDSGHRRLFQLEMMQRGYYVAQRGTINLSLPLTDRELDSFVDAVGIYLAEYRALLEEKR